MKHRQLTKLSTVAIVVGALGAYAGSASAAPTCPETNDPAADYKCVFFNTGTDFNGNGKTTTSSFYELGYTGTLATSIYSFVLNGAGQPVIGAGSQIVDSNKTNVLNYHGLTGGPTNYLSLGGTTVTLKDTADFPGESNVDNLNGPSAGRDTNRFDASNDLGGLGWGLTYEYLLLGSLNATGPSFNDGFFDIFFENWVTGQRFQVLRMNVTGSQLLPSNLSVMGFATFDWAGGMADKYGNSMGDGTNDCAASDLCASFFNFQTSSPPEFWALEGQGVNIMFTLDSNVNPPIPTANQLVAFTGTDQQRYAIRQTTLDGSIRFDTAVPEPASLALVGLGLAGLGYASRRRRSA